ncbi:PaaI family thioesterase [Algihabitans albus]|uniref:PaaI family thioesterase n=1 Tax=Algihabitans albus TaxID=2164067 RepID=UPI000E5C9D05|nr:PaaI family thioesterase [Algihabitans albus]
MNDRPHRQASDVPDAADLPGEAPVGFQITLGFRVAEWSDGHCVLALEVDERHTNRSGVLHGGVISSLLDQAMSLTGLYCPHPDRVRRSVTLSMSTNFTGQCSGGQVRAIGRLQARGRRIYSCSGEVLGPDGALLGIGTGTFRLRRGSETSEGVLRDSAPLRSDHSADQEPQS